MQQHDGDDDKAPANGRSWATPVAAVVALVVLALWLISWWFLSPLESADRGTWGDMFGGINALFSGLAFVGVIYAILLQREELQLQRYELVSTRAELRGQREANERQNEFISTQVFENTLFQMLSVLNNVIDAIDRRGTNATLLSKGRDAIGSFFRTFAAVYRNEAIRLAKAAGRRSEDQEEFSPDPVLTYDSFYKKYGHELGHYFRLLYNIFKFIDESSVDDKRRYSNIVRAQMSDLEAAMLFYNSLTTRGENFRKYIDRYGLLKFVQDDYLLRVDHRNLHDPAAFGETRGRTDAVQAVPAVEGPPAARMQTRKMVPRS